MIRTLCECVWCGVLCLCVCGGVLDFLSLCMYMHVDVLDLWYFLLNTHHNYCFQRCMMSDGSIRLRCPIHNVSPVVSPVCQWVCCVRCVMLCVALSQVHVLQV